MLTAYFDTWIDPSEAWAAIETVTSADSDPCATLVYADGDAAGPEPASCVRAGPGLWWRRTADDSVGWVLRSGGITIALTGSGDDRAALLRSIRTAHPATEAELQERTGLVPRSLTGWLLL